MKKSILAAFLCLLAFNVMAQEQKQKKSNELNKYFGPYETNSFCDNWYFGIGGGINIYTGESDKLASFGKRIAPALDVTIGKWITPDYGMRIQYSGLSARGATHSGAPFANGLLKGSLYKEKFSVMNLHSDFMWNVSNSLFGYKERMWNFIPFLGGGIAHAWNGTASNSELAVSAGFVNTFTITNRIDLTLEARQMFVNQRFDGVAGGSRIEGMSSVTVGVNYKFGKKGFKRVQKVNYAPYKATIADLKAKNKVAVTDLESKNKALTTEREELGREIAELNKKLEDLAEVNKKASESPNAVLFFEFDQFTLNKEDLLKLDLYVKKALKIDENKVFTIVGSADSTTGSQDYNQLLSEKRAQFIYNILANTYNIPKHRLIIQAEGDTNNRFGSPVLNRSVIFTN